MILALWATGGILAGMLLVTATLRFGLAGFLFMVALIAAIVAAILSTTGT